MVRMVKSVGRGGSKSTVGTAYVQTRRGARAGVQGRGVGGLCLEGPVLGSYQMPPLSRPQLLPKDLGDLQEVR
jgi:hypothetical protein